MSTHSEYESDASTTRDVTKAEKFQIYKAMLSISKNPCCRKALEQGESDKAVRNRTSLNSLYLHIKTHIPTYKTQHEYVKNPPTIPFNPPAAPIDTSSGIEKLVASGMKEINPPKPLSETNSFPAKKHSICKPTDEAPPFGPPTDILAMPPPVQPPVSAKRQHSPEGDNGPEGTFLKPKRTASLRKLFNTDNSKNIEQVALKNQYDALQNMDIETEAEPGPSRSQEEVHEKAKQAEQPKKRTSKPPPLIIQGRITSHSELCKELKLVTAKRPLIKYAKNSVILNCDTIQDYRAVKALLINEKAPFHTYADSEERTHAFVLRGLDGGITPEEVKDDLIEEHGLKTKEVYLMKNTFRPLFLIVTDANQTLTKLNHNIRYVLQTSVKWENRKSEKNITQCRRCQGWGHSSKNCYKAIKCSKCAGPHEIINCGPNNKIKCANCSGDHRSFDEECPVYNFKMDQILSRRPAPAKKQYVAAPAPTVNAWEKKTSGTGVGRPPHQVKGRPRRDTTTEYESDYESDFPDALGRGRAAQPPPQSRTYANRGGNDGQAGKFHDLTNKFQQLAELTNLDEMMAALDLYIDMLGKCSSQVERFKASEQFFTREIRNFKF